MADFNQISVNSSLTVTPVNFASLGFNDNLLIPKSKYSISNNILNVLVPTTDTISIFSNNGIATTYEFEYIRLNTPGVILPNVDINNKQVVDLAQNKILVFVNGQLQPTSAYTVLDPSTLKFNINYTNDYNKLFQINIYSSTLGFQRITYTAEQIAALQVANTIANKEEDLIQNKIALPVTYDYKNTLLFINEHKVPFNAIELLGNGNEVRLNIPERLLYDVKTFEVIKLESSTTSINFATKQGYDTYGPYDDFGKKLSNTYDIIFKFTDQVKLLIDNVRTGFIIKEAEGIGKAVIVDTNFESMEVKALQIQPFPYTSYMNNQYYVEVPEATNIVKYLAEFDKRYTFLPEILTVFQRLLLDDINDTIQRMRDARSISRVDSVHINKLISLLGFNINIKQLNKKQRRELLEELTEFYRVVGTRYSYNLINVLQNNLKLISADQLFTPSGLQKRKNQTLYDYTASVTEGKAGSGYAVGDALALENSGLVVRVDEVYEEGDPEYETNPNGIKAISLETAEGYKEITQSFTLKSILNGTFKVNSTPSLYAYNWSISDSSGCLPNMVLQSASKSYGVKVNTINPDGSIDTFTPITSRHNTEEDIANVNFNALQLYRLVDDLSVKITSEPVYSDDEDYGDPIYTNTSGGADFEVPLKQGTYIIELAGAGGAGGAADSRTGNEYDLPATNGCNGELKRITLTLTADETITGRVGQGGGNVKARGHDSQPYNNKLGNGFNNGALGQLLHLTQEYNWWSHLTYSYLFRSRTYKASYGNIAGGQGGGSTGLRNSKGEIIAEARGGNGGNASGRLGEKTNGGIGGGGGVTSGNGGKGGSRAYGGNFWSQNGSNGWVKIYQVPSKYNIQVIGDLTKVGDGEVYETIESGEETFVITAHVDSEHNVTFTYTPEEGSLGYDNTFNLKTQVDNATAKLSIQSEVSLWDYNVKLSADATHLSQGSTFVNLDSPPDQQFTFVVSTPYTTEGTWTPTQGTEKITLENVPAYTREGEGGEISISSTANTQKNEDRCYIDFYKKEELGADPILEFRSDTIEYGNITEGSPNSPKWWEVGSPDIEYGTITNDTTNFIEYGKITESTAGEWVEWWKWDREKNWYPTNHVDLEMKLPPGVNFSEYVDTFVEQFYNLASAVVFIHQITESFYFGNDTTTNYNSQIITKDGIIGDAGAMIAPFGIVSTMPLLEYESIITSDPTRQYIDPLGFIYDVTIIPQVPNATVSVITETISSTGEIIQNVVVLTENDNWTTQVQYGTTITYKVEAPGYITRATTQKVMKSITKYVTLTPETPTKLGYYSLHIDTNVPGAKIMLTTNNITSLSSTIYNWEGNVVQYMITCPGYASQKGSVVLTEDTVLTIQLEPAVELNLITYPVDTNITITIDGQQYTPKITYDVNSETGNITQVNHIISVPVNKEFTYEVARRGYITKTAAITLTQATKLNVALVPLQGI